MKSIQSILEQNKIKKIRLYEQIIDKFNVKFTYPAFVNWINGKRTLPLDYIWIFHRAINQMVNKNISITEILYTSEGIAELEAKYLRAA
jgi:hypothetical protein